MPRSFPRALGARQGSPTPDARRPTLFVATPGISCPRAPLESRSVASNDASRTPAGCGPPHLISSRPRANRVCPDGHDVRIHVGPPGSGRQSVAYRPRRCVRWPLDPPLEFSGLARRASRDETQSEPAGRRSVGGSLDRNALCVYADTQPRPPNFQEMSRSHLEINAT
jgi:hypothetical protein